MKKITLITLLLIALFALHTCYSFGQSYRIVETNFVSSKKVELVYYSDFQYKGQDKWAVKVNGLLLPYKAYKNGVAYFPALNEWAYIKNSEIRKLNKVSGFAVK